MRLLTVVQNAAVVCGLMSDENVYRGEKGFTESGASCDTLSSKLKRLAARYEQYDDIADGKDIVGTIEPQLHANVGKDVLDEKQRPSEITDPGELSSSDSGCDSGNSCDRSFNDDCHNCVEDTYKADARWLDDGCGARELCISEEDHQRLDGGCCARSTCMGEGDVDGRGSRGLDSSKMDELRGCEAGLDSESESEYEDDEQYLRLEETILQQEEVPVIEVLGRDLKKFEDGKRQFKERVEEWEKQSSREKDALVELRERYEKEWLEWEEEKSQMKIKRLQHEHESKVLRELEREVKEKQLQLECRESDMEARALTLEEGEQKLKQREIQFDEWFEQWENNKRMQEEEFKIRRAEDLKERKLWETDLRKRELVLSAKVEKYKKKACESCLGARQEALLEAEAKSDERREQFVMLEDRNNQQCERRQGIRVVRSEEGSGVEDRGRGRNRQRKACVKQRRYGGRSDTGKSHSEVNRESTVDGCTQQRKRNNSEFRTKSAVQSPSLMAESSSNELDDEAAQVEIRGRQAYEEMDCGDNVHSTGRNGKVREGECGVCDDLPPMQRVKRVQNAEKYDPKLHSKPKREKQPLTYDGNSSWKDFYVHFEACKVYNGWVDQEATYQLFTCCRGNALTMLRVNDVDPKEMRYSELVKLIGKEFGPRECSELYFHELSKREQQPGESLRSLGQDIKRLTALAFPRIGRKERDRIALEHFKQAVADPELRKELFQTHPDQGGDTPYTKARRFLSTCERGHLELRSIACVIIL